MHDILFQSLNIMPMMFIHVVTFCISLLRLPKYHRLGGLKNRNLFSHCSVGWKSQIKMSAELVSSGASLLDLWMTVFSLSSRGLSSVVVSVSISSSQKNTSYFGSGTIQMTSFQCNCLFKDFISKYTHMRYWGLDFNMCIWELVHNSYYDTGLFFSIAKFYFIV